MLNRILSIVLMLALFVSLVSPGASAAPEVYKQENSHNLKNNMQLANTSIASTELVDKQQDRLVQFTDVNPGDWFYEAVQYVGQNNLFQGTGDNQFSPLGTMTRAMFVTVLGRIAGVQTEEYSSSAFTDVSPNEWYAPYVEWAVEHNITSGTGDGKFSPNGIISREQMATFMVRFFDAFNIPLTKNEQVTSEPKDIGTVSSWAVSPIQRLWQAGLIKGDPAGNYNPHGKASRAEAATFLMRSNEVVVTEQIFNELPGPSPSGAPSASPSPVPVAPGGGGPNPTPSPNSFTISFESNGGTEVESYTLNRSETLGLLPASHQPDHVFLGWYTNPELTQPAHETTIVDKNMTLYARFEALSSLNENPVASKIRSELNQQKSHTVAIYSSQANMTSDEVKAGFTFESINDEDYASTTGVEVTGSDHQFTLAANNAKKEFVEGDTYRVLLTDEKLSFTNYEDSVRELVFSIERAEVYNVKMNPLLVEIPSAEITEMKLDGEQAAINPTSLNLFEVNIGNNSTNEVIVNNGEGTFKYSGEAIVLGDTIAIYDGLKPSERNLSTSSDNTAVTYVEVIGVSGENYSFKMAEYKNVMFTPDLLPFDTRRDTDMDPDNNVIVVGTNVFLYADDVYTELNVNRNFDVQVGDYLALHDEDTVSGIKNNVDRIVRITGLEERDDVYTITVENSSKEKMKQDSSYYERPDVKYEDLSKNPKAAKVAQQIKQQIVDSGFMDDSVRFLVASTLMTEEFGKLQEEYDLPVEEMQSIASSTKSLVDFESEKFSFELTAFDVTPSTDLQRYKEAYGVSVVVTLGALIKIAINDDLEIAIKLDATFENEFALNPSLSKEEVDEVGDDCGWLWCGTDTIITTDVDIMNYTAISFQANLGLFEKDDDENDELDWDENKYTIDFSEEIENIVEAAKGGEEKTTVTSFAERYQEMLENDTDWVSLVEEELGKFEYTDPTTGIAIKITLSFVVKAMVNISLGADFENEVIKKMILTLNVDKKRFNEKTITTKDEFTFTLYVMGTVGLRVGVELKVEVGLISTAFASVGAKVELGGYIQLWGYFYFKLSSELVDNPKNPKGPQISETKSEYRGDYLLEIGVYVTISVFTQAFFGTFTAEKELLDEQFPIISFGNATSVVGFPKLSEEDLTRKFGNRKTMTLPRSLFSMNVMPMKKSDDELEEGLKLEEKGSTDFVYEFSNPDDFSIDPKTRRITYTGDETFAETTLKMTWKDAPKQLDPKRFTITLNLTYGTLKDHYTISLFSIEDAGQRPALLRTIEIPYNGAVAAPDSPTRLGYVFKHWYTDEKGTSLATMPATMPAANLSYYAKWERDPAVPYTIRIMIKDPATKELVLHDTIKGTAAEGSVIQNNQKYTHYIVTENNPFIVNAGAINTREFIYEPKDYEIYFDRSLADTGFLIRYLTYGSKFRTPADSPYGYQLEYWNLELPDGSVQRIEPNGEFEVTGKMKFTGVYTPQLVPIVVAFHTLYSRDNISDSFLYGKRIEYGTVGSSFTASDLTLPKPRWEKKYNGYRLADGLEQSRSLAVVKPNDANQVIVYYDITFEAAFKANGGVEPDTKLELRPGDPITAPTFTRPGYEFVGWSPELPSVMDGNNYVYTAQWKIAEASAVNYKVEYYLEDLVVEDYIDLAYSDPEWWNYERTFDYEKTYTLTDTDTFTSIAGENASVTPKDITGFTYDSSHAGNVTNGDVTADGQLTLKVYYSRNVYELKFIEELEFSSGDGTYESEVGSYLVKYGDFIRIQFENEEDAWSESGLLFGGWKPVDGAPDLTTPDGSTPTMPDRNITYVMIYKDEV